MGMKTTVEIGKTYALRSEAGGEVTDVDGKPLETLEPNKQVHMTAQESEWIIPDDCKVTKVNFKNARLALRMLGAGDSGLPAGYMQLAFLEAPSGGVGIDVEYVPTADSGFRTEFEELSSSAQYQHVLSSAGLVLNNDGSLNKTNAVIYTPHLNNANYKFFAAKYRADGTAWTYARYNAFPIGKRLQADFNWLNDSRLKCTDTPEVEIPPTLIQRDNVQTWLFCLPMSPEQSLHGRIYSAAISEGKRIVRNFVPAVDRRGQCCVVDIMHGRTYLSKTDALLVAGFTLEQARKLGKLPAGTNLTISLPKGWQDDEGVAEAKAQAEANGCVLPVQEYTAQASAATTYSLRRIWVRKTQADYGSYVDADGTRWLVEWCVDVIGADPETLGYERFRSVEAAVEYWELTQYVEPETLTEIENNEND